MKNINTLLSIVEDLKEVSDKETQRINFNTIEKRINNEYERNVVLFDNGEVEVVLNKEEDKLVLSTTFSNQVITNEWLAKVQSLQNIISKYSECKEIDKNKLTQCEANLKTVGEVIGEINNKSLKRRIERLISSEAPKIIINQNKKMYKENCMGNVKVKGLSRKHKIKDELVKKVTHIHTKGRYFNKTADTTVFILELANGKTYYYDFYENKIEDKYNRLNVAFSKDFE